MLQDMFGEDSVPKMFKGEKFYVSVNDTKADIDLSTLVILKTWILSSLSFGVLQEVSCPADETFQQIVQTAVTKLYQSLAPPQVENFTN